MSTLYWTDIHGHKWPVTAAMASWLTAYQDEALRLGRAQQAAGKPVTYIKYGLDLFQTIGGAAASGGTHLEVDGKACCIDTAQISYDMVRLAREMGGDATWKRGKNWDGRGGMVHCHINLRGIANKYANYQYSSTYSGVDHGHNGLANGAKDDGPKPLSKRTYSEGIAWTNAQAAAAAAPLPPVVIPNTVLRAGYGNLFGAYLPTDIDKARFRAQLSLIHTMRVSLFIALELHEENGSKGMLAFYKIEAAKYGLAIAEGKGGNQLIYDPKKYEILSTTNKSMGTRWASKWNVKRIGTGLPFWAAAFHTPAGSTPARVLARQTETKNFLAFIAGLQRVVVGIDKNNAASFLGSPTKQLKDAGLKSIYTSVAVENAQFNSHHDTKDTGAHIDDLAVGLLAAFTDGAQVRTAALSDHDWLWGDITIKGVAA